MVVAEGSVVHAAADAVVVYIVENILRLVLNVGVDVDGVVSYKADSVGLVRTLLGAVSHEEVEAVCCMDKTLG